MHLTNRKKGSKLKAGYKNTKKFLKTKLVGSTKLTVNATQCHDGPRTLWLPKLENAIYQNFKWNNITFSINSPSLKKIFRGGEYMVGNSSSYLSSILLL